MNYEGFEVKEGSKIEKVDELITDIGISRRYQEVDDADLSFEEYCNLYGVEDYDKAQWDYEQECKSRDQLREVWLDREIAAKEELKIVMKEIPLDTLNSFLIARTTAYRKDALTHQKSGDLNSKIDADFQVKATNTARALVLKIEKDKQK
ncbi:MAG: hypothetical protein J6J24_00150 [Clostridia bacterium]|nr:hypothetical protein [Clostridia bacterium]